MTKTLTTPRRFTLAAAAFGLASLVAGAASAHPAASADAVHASIDGRSVTRHEGHYRIAPIDPYWRAMRQFDTNRNRLVDAGEKKGFWTYMAESGAYGRFSVEEVQRFGQLAFQFDADRDGRLVGVERRGMDKLVDTLRVFKRLDRNGDRQLSAYETGFSAFSPRFHTIDRNGDRRLSQQEVRDDVLRAYRNGE